MNGIYMKSKITMLIFGLQLLTFQSHALFVATLPIRLMTGFKVSVSKGDKQESLGGKFFKLVINIVFGIVGENGEAVQVDEKILADLGYSAKEIEEFKNKDIPNLKEFSENNSFQSMEELVQALNKLNLGKVAQEQIRIDIENSQD